MERRDAAQRNARTLGSDLISVYGNQRTMPSMFSGVMGRQ